MVGALEMEKPIYVGCSMGGHLAPDLALLRAGLVPRGRRGRRRPRHPRSRAVQQIPLASPRLERGQGGADDVADLAEQPRAFPSRDGLGLQPGRAAGFPGRPRLLSRRARSDDDGVDRSIRRRRRSTSSAATTIGRRRPNAARPWPTRSRARPTPGWKAWGIFRCPRIRCRSNGICRLFSTGSWPARRRSGRRRENSRESFAP